jgi:hypothetical protein
METGQKYKTITISPDIFINPPYIKCPKCSKVGFGVLPMFNRSGYSRRCRYCLYVQSFKLPVLDKKIIYIDQMGISEMMKSINPKIKAETKAKLKPIWLQLFNKLDRLVKFNLIICPDSNSHYQESLVWQSYFKSLKMMYEHLSNGISFFDEDTIKRFQIINNFKAYVGFKDLKDLSVHNITTDEINSWLSRFRISVDMGSFDESMVENIRNDRDQIDQYFVSVYKRWQTEKNKKFEDWYDEETKAYLPTLMKEFSFRLILSEMFRKLESIGKSETEAPDIITEYFKSGNLIQIPYVNISAGLFASLARKASQGKKTLPTKGMVTDVKTIASVSPYCDAMLIDNECRAILNEEPLKTKLKLHTLFFSQSNIKEFMDYLDNIEKSAKPKHIKTIKEVYGDTWGQPFVEMYDQEP